MGRVVVLGSINTDFVLKGQRLPAPGETVMGTEYFQVFGGKGGNQAVAAARAGASVTFIAAAGDDALGREAIEHYAMEKNLDASHIKVVRGHANGLALILVDAHGQNMISIFPGANAALSRGDIENLPEGIFERDAVLVVQLETPLDTVLAGFERAREAGMTTILNPAPAMPAEKLSPLLAFTDILVPNESEALQLTDIAVNDEKSAFESARSLLSMGRRAVIITLGERGCVVAVKEESTSSLRVRCVFVPAMKVSTIDCVAAGDAFVGALACKLSESEASRRLSAEVLLDAARWATHAAAISVTRAGAQPSLPRRAEIEASFRESSPR